MTYSDTILGTILLTVSFFPILFFSSLSFSEGCFDKTGQIARGPRAFLKLGRMHVVRFMYLPYTFGSFGCGFLCHVFLSSSGFLILFARYFPGSTLLRTV